jgi:hypothetical protein
MKVLFGSLCSRKPCNGSTSYPAFRVRTPSHAVCLPNGTAGQQTVHWTVLRRGNLLGVIEVMRQRMVNVDLHSSSKWSFFSSPCEPCIFRFSANEELWCCSEPVFMALKNLPIKEPQGPEFLSVSLRSHLIQIFEGLILHQMPRFRLRQFHYNIKSTGLCNWEPACFLRSRTRILCRVHNSAY